MIYLDSSVALAALFAEPRTPPQGFWQLELVSSRLLEIEVTIRVFTRGVGAQNLAAAQDLLAKVTMIDMSRSNLARALKPFPAPIRTLDSLHLATMVFLADAGQTVQLASYDKRLVEAAAMLGISSLAL